MNNVFHHNSYPQFIMQPNCVDLNIHQINEPEFLWPADRFETGGGITTGSNPQNVRGS